MAGLTVKSQTFAEVTSPIANFGYTNPSADGLLGLGFQSISLSGHCASVHQHGQTGRHFTANLLRLPQSVTKLLKIS